MAGKIVILTALKEELAAVQAAIPDGQRSDALLIRAGVGHNATLKALQSLGESGEKPRLLCTTGFCGGLAEGVAVGDIVLAETVLDSAQPSAPCQIQPPIERDALRARLEQAGIRCHAGALISVREPVTQATAKRALGRQHNAVAVDMESFTVVTEGAQLAQHTLVLRAVSDAVDDELPAEVGEFLDEAGNVRVANVARFAARGPGNMKLLWGLKSRTDKAAASLTAAWKTIWPELCAATGLNL